MAKKKNIDVVIDEELEALFGSGESLENGDIVVQPSMPLLMEQLESHLSVAEAVDEHLLDQSATNEPSPKDDEGDLDLGDMIRLPDGTRGELTWISADRKRVGIGKGRNKTFYSLHAIEKQSGRRIASDAHRHKSEQAAVERQPPPAPTMVPDIPEGLTLFPHQIETLSAIGRNEGRLIIGDEMGLGKTAVSAVALRPPAVVVCPASIVVNWVRELNRWRPELSVAMISGLDTSVVTPEQKQADVVVLNYHILHAHLGWLENRRYATVLADEAQYLKNTTIEWNKDARTHVVNVKKSPRWGVAFFKLQRGVDSLLFLTGTPLMNRTRELYPLLHMLDPQTWGSFWQFCQRYCAGHWEYFPQRGGGSGKAFNCNGRSNTDELNARLNDRYMVRHTKEAELKNLPAKWRQTRLVSLEPKYAVLYRKAALDFMGYLAKHGGPEAVAKAERAKALVMIGKLRALSARGKVRAAVEWISTHFESTQRPLIVFGRSREAFDAIEDGLEKVNEHFDKAVRSKKSPWIPRRMRVAKVLGETSAGARQKAIDAFQAGEVDVILYSIQIATGTTLTRAQDVLFLEREWRPSDQLQAEDRAHRIGQMNQVIITYLDAAGTIDSNLAHLLMEKAKTFAAVIDGKNLSADEAFAQVYGEMFNVDAEAKGEFDAEMEKALRALNPNLARGEDPYFIETEYGFEPFDGYAWDEPVGDVLDFPEGAEPDTSWFDPL
jgi:SNF2 family DNA or RNA helicase